MHTISLSEMTILVILERLDTTALVFVGTRFVAFVREPHFSLYRCDFNMWISPKPTLGGAGMWEEVRSNGIIQLQHYKPDGTVLAGTFTRLAFTAHFFRQPRIQITAR